MKVLHKIVSSFCFTDKERSSGATPQKSKGKVLGSGTVDGRSRDFPRAGFGRFRRR